MKYILFIICALFVAGCTNANLIDNNQAVIVTNVPTSAPNVELNTQSDDENFNDDIEREKLFEEIKVYDAAEVVNLQLENKQYSTIFVKDRYEPFGFYLPSNMEVFSYEDGDNWGYENQMQNHVSLVMYDNVVENLELTNEKLGHFDEYVGTEMSYDQHSDYFLLEHNENKYIIILSYYDSEKEKALPLFLSFVKTIRLIENEW